MLFSWFVRVGNFVLQDFCFVSEQLFGPGGLEFEEANLQMLKYTGVTPRGRGWLRVRKDLLIHLCIFFWDFTSFNFLFTNTSLISSL